MAPRKDADPKIAAVARRLRAAELRRQQEAVSAARAKGLFRGIQVARRLFGRPR